MLLLLFLTLSQVSIRLFIKNMFKSKFIKTISYHLKHFKFQGKYHARIHICTKPKIHLIFSCPEGLIPIFFPHCVKCLSNYFLLRCDFLFLLRDLVLLWLFHLTTPCSLAGFSWILPLWVWIKFCSVNQDCNLPM